MSFFFLRGLFFVAGLKGRADGSRATLLSLPSTVVRLGDGTPVAWAFLGRSVGQVAVDFC